MTPLHRLISHPANWTPDGVPGSWGPHLQPAFLPLLPLHTDLVPEGGRMPHPKLCGSQDGNPVASKTAS